MRVAILNATKVVAFLFAAFVIPVTFENTVEEADPYRLTLLAVVLASLSWLVIVGYLFGKGAHSRALVISWAGLLLIVLFGIWWNDPATQWDRALKYSTQTGMISSLGNTGPASNDADLESQRAQYRRYLVAKARLDATPLAQREHGDGLGRTVYGVYGAVSLLIMLGVVIGTRRHSSHADL